MAFAPSCNMVAGPEERDEENRTADGEEGEAREV
jgi:hypothetical protein